MGRAIGCNLAWGIIDAAFYLIGCISASGRNGTLLRALQTATDPANARALLADVMPSKVAEALEPADLDRIRARLSNIELPGGPKWTAHNFRGALGVFLLVFVSTFPVVLPFLFIHELQFALRISNGVAIFLLFASGYMLANYAGLRRVVTGLAMVAIGSSLVAVAIALGG